MSFAVRDFFLNGGTQAIIIRLTNGTPAASKYVIPATPIAKNLKIVAANPGSWGDNLSFTINYDTKTTDTNLFNLVVSETNGLTETHLNVSIDSASPRYLPKILEQRSELIRVSQTSGGVYEIFDVRPNATTTAITILTGTVGTDGTNLTSTSFVDTNFDRDKKGLYALEKADIFNLLCIPPYLSTNDIDQALIASLLAYCLKRRAVLILDPPSSWTTASQAKTGLLATYPLTTSNYAALFFPRLKQPNPLNDNLIEEFVPCGAIAGVIARTDSQRGVWKAPAGQEAQLNGVPELSVPLTDMENGDLNQLGINCLRTFPVYGRLVWGSRTLEGADRLASEWKYLPVRRTALYIEESLFRGLKWVVFEPNDEPLWAQIRLNVGAFMHDLFRQGAFQGQTPKDAYFVKCDKETTTQSDINLGIVNIWVGFAPLKPAEFVILHIQQIAGQINQ